MSENWISTQNQDPCINSWPLKQIWTKWAHLYLRGFFLNKYTVNPPYPQVSHLQTCPTMDQKQYFESLVGNPWMWRANRMRCSTSFYTRDLSILRFWYLRTVLEPIPHGYLETTVIVFWENQVICRFSTA